MRRILGQRGFVEYLTGRMMPEDPETVVSERLKRQNEALNVLQYRRNR